jgi:hypothetical protein
MENETPIMGLFGLFTDGGIQVRSMRHLPLLHSRAAATDVGGAAVKPRRCLALGSQRALMSDARTIDVYRWYKIVVHTLLYPVLLHSTPVHSHSIV